MNNKINLIDNFLDKEQFNKIKQILIGNDFHCENLMFEQNPLPEEISKYFNCICNQTEEVGWNDYVSRSCSLNFSIESRESQDNKMILTIITPKDVPSITIKGEQCEIIGTIPGSTNPSSRCDKICEQTVNLKTGINEIKTNCNYTEPESSTWDCVGLFYNEYKIAEIGCRYFA
jgi:hypothetical protein